ncbi:unnamed protein product, partial [Protopolystoma xenopodis]
MEDTTFRYMRQSAGRLVAGLICPVLILGRWSDPVTRPAGRSGLFSGSLPPALLTAASVPSLPPTTPTPTHLATVSLESRLHPTAGPPPLLPLQTAASLPLVPSGTRLGDFRLVPSQRCFPPPGPNPPATAHLVSKSGHSSADLSVIYPAGAPPSLQPGQSALHTCPPVGKAATSSNVVSPGNAASTPTSNPAGGLTSPATTGLSGMLVVHLIAGSGLNSSHVLLRDLYCVLETDAIRKARSMIRTSREYFEWNEVFEVELEENRFLALLLYQWDPRTRHRLCFYGGLDLVSLLQTSAPSSQQAVAGSGVDTTTPECTGLGTTTGVGVECGIGSSRERMEETKRRQPSHGFGALLSPFVALANVKLDKIALQLEPKGLLYLELGFVSMGQAYRRRQSTHAIVAASSTGILFGVRIDQVVEREHRVVELIGQRAYSTALMAGRHGQQ